MFGSNNPFGQSSSSPFGPQTGFGQTSSVNNPFAPKPFGSITPFGSATGGSIFGSTSTGVFGASQSSPFGSTPAFGASNTAFGGSTPAFGASSTPAFGSSTPAFGASATPAFGSSTPAFGASTTPAFGSSSSAFGGSSVFGQTPAFGGFGSAPSQSSPFGSTFQQPNPATGSSLFSSSTPFGTSNPSPFGVASTPAFGSSSAPAFGATNPFGASSAPAFGATSTPGFGTTTTPAFGNTSFGASSAPGWGSGGAFGASNAGSVFGSSTTPAFGASTVPAFGGASTPFGAPSTPLFGSSPTPFGASSSSSFGFGSSSAFGQSTPAFGSNIFGSTTPSFGAQSSSLGAQSAIPAFGAASFGQSAFGGQRGGSRVVAFAATPEADTGTSTQASGKLESISAMPTYKEKSHEELRWEDYQLGDKGGKNPSVQSGFGVSSAQTNPFNASLFGQSSSNPFNAATSSNPFAPKPATFGNSAFGSATVSPFSSSFGVSTTSNLFPSSSPATSSLFGTQSSNIFGSSSSMFSASSSPFGVGTSSSMFGSTSGQGTFGSGLFANSQSSPLFQSTTPSFGQTGSMFGQTIPQTPAFGQPSIFSTPTAGFGGNLFSSTPALSSSNPIGFSQPSLSFPTSFQPTQPAQATGTVGFANLGQTQIGAGGFGTFANNFGQSYGQSPALPSYAVVQPPPITNPYGTLPAPLQLSVGPPGMSPSLQYGISSMPVADKPTPVKISPLLTSRHLTVRRNMRLPTRRQHPNSDGPKIPFFEDGTPTTPKADALLVRRENPRALVVQPIRNPSLRALAQKNTSPATQSERQNGRITEPTNTPDEDSTVGKLVNGHVHNHSITKSGVEDGASGRRVDTTLRENGTVEGNGTAIESAVPKLRHADYYTEPRIRELEESERSQPGFCRCIKDFVVGRDGYGRIKFFGETDVRGLDLESVVQFNYREVCVYAEESKKPAVGQGLNKPAEVTIYNVKCFDKRTGEQQTEGRKLERFREILVRKTEEQGARLLLCDPVKGIWKFKVDHF